MIGTTEGYVMRHDDGFGRRKSPFSNSQGNSVEVEPLPNGSVRVHDSKRGSGSPALTFTSDQWPTFLEQVKGGTYTGLVQGGLHGFRLTNAFDPKDKTALDFDLGEILAFTAGAGAGAFDRERTAV